MCETPYYQFNQTLLAELLESYQSYGNIFFPIKANDSAPLIEYISQSDCGFEVDSLEHAHLLIDKYNVAPDLIIYSHLVRSRKDIREAANLGIKLFVVDTEEDMDRIDEVVSSPKYFLRINVNSMLNLLPPEKDKWGFEVEKAIAIFDAVRNISNKIWGVSFYLSAEINTVQNVATVLNNLSSAFSNSGLSALNIGGGISISMLKQLRPLLNATLESTGIEKLVIEPGRHLLDPCFDLITSVLATRDIKGTRFLFIDSGIYFGLIDVIIKNKRFSIEDECEFANSPTLREYIICGASSDVSDVLGKYQLRENISVGDKLRIRGCGAYSSVMQTHFYGKLPNRTAIVNEL
jgi:ornithine decarboxylase